MLKWIAKYFIGFIFVVKFTLMSDSVRKLFDIDALIKRRARAKLLGYEDFFCKLLIDDLKSRLTDINRNFEKRIMIGPFVEYWQNQIRNLDFEIGMDLDNLNLKKQYDLILHCLCLHWANDPLGKLIQLRMSLKPEGLLMGFLFGGNTLNELRVSFSKAEVALESSLSLRVAPMMELKSFGNLLVKAGFKNTVVDLIPYKIQYSSLNGLFLDLRKMGETNVINKRKKIFLTKSVFDLMVENYKRDFSQKDGKFNVTFDIFCFTGWKS